MTGHPDQPSTSNAAANDNTAVIKAKYNKCYQNVVREVTLVYFQSEFKLG